MLTFPIREKNSEMYLLFENSMYPIENRYLDEILFIFNNSVITIWFEVGQNIVRYL